jgi:two-component system chemotaxis response regulator CheB
MTVPRKIRVLIVDDSAVVRKMASDALAADPGIEVVGTAADPYFARDKIRELAPDVVTLDLEMPRMDGLTFLRLIMEQRPLPVIVMSSLSQSGSEHALEALRLGAIDVLGKPSGSYSFGQLGTQLIAKVKAAAGAKIRAQKVAPSHLSRPPFAPGTTAAPAGVPITRVPFPSFALPRSALNPRSVILLGASTGGTEALREVLTRLPAGLPGIAIVQHIPPVFSKAFANRLNTLCALEVREAVDGERLLAGTALVAPGNFHLLLQWRSDHYTVRVTDGPQVWHQRPAVDLLFKSAADAGAGPHALAGILTGMGRDGAEGLLRLRNEGATTFAQDEATSVVYGMPRAAWENGAAQSQLPLERVASAIVRQFAMPGLPALTP